MDGKNAYCRHAPYHLICPSNIPPLREVTSVIHVFCVRRFGCFANSKYFDVIFLASDESFVLAALVWNLLAHGILHHAVFVSDPNRAMPQVPVPAKTQGCRRSPLQSFRSRFHGEHDGKTFRRLTHRYFSCWYLVCFDFASNTTADAAHGDSCFSHRLTHTFTTFSGRSRRVLKVGLC